MFCRSPINVVSTQKQSLSLPSLSFVLHRLSSELEMNSHILQKSVAISTLLISIATISGMIISLAVLSVVISSLVICT